MNSVPILSATLADDDVAIAEQWLAKPPQQWQDMTLVEQWQQQFADWLGVSTAMAWLGGRASLYAAIEALGLKAGDEVILPAFTCQCVVNAFRYRQIEVRYADIEIETYGMDVASAAQVITPKTRAILLQYSFGLVCRDIAALLALAKQHQLLVIEDCAHALGARWRGRLLGSFGDVAIFSSERSKIINTIHGGLVTTNRQDVAQRLQQMAHQAPLPDNEKTAALLRTVLHDHALYIKHNPQQADSIAAQGILPQMFAPEFEGIFTRHYTERINAPIAALAINQFSKMVDLNRCRLAASAGWQQWCLQQGYTPPLVIADSLPTFLRYPICVTPEQKQDRRWIEQPLNITTGVWFTSAAHPLPLELSHCPIGAKAARQCINLPTLLADDFFSDKNSHPLASPRAVQH